MIKTTATDLLKILFPPIVVLILHIIRQFVWPLAVDFDMLAHFLGGLSIAWSALIFSKILVRRGVLTKKVPSWLIHYAIFGTVALVGVFWEFYEFYGGFSVYDSYDNALADSMADLALDLLGATLFITAIRARLWKRGAHVDTSS